MDNFNAIIDDFSNAGGRRKACKSQGLRRKEKRECARQLKASGWKKGQPIPADMAGITHEDVAQSEKEDSSKSGSGEMSMTTKALIGGGVAVVLIGGFFLIKKMRASKPVTA